MATEVGPLATARQRDTSRRSLPASVAAGARLITGGPATAGEGYFYRPTILDCDGTGAPSLDEEFFGPVLSVVSLRH